MTDVVVKASGEAGLAHILGGLVEANLARDPGLEALLASRRAVAVVEVTDTGVAVGLTFVPGAVTVTDTELPGADLHIAGDAEVVLGLTRVPLRFGLPDVTTPAGREVVAALLRRRLRVRGLVRGLGLLRTLTRLLNVG